MKSLLKEVAGATEFRQRFLTKSRNVSFVREYLINVCLWNKIA